MTTVLLIGGGNLGSALARGWLGFCHSDASRNLETPSFNGVTLKIVTQSGIAHDPALQPYTSTVLPVITPDTIIVIAVKPHQIREVVTSLFSYIHDGQRIVSVAAGVRLEQLQSLAPHAHWMRAMPSLAAANRQSITGLLACDAPVAGLFARLGRTVTVADDAGIDAIAVLVACGVGVMAAYAQAWVDAARPLIQDESALREIVADMITSSGAMLKHSDDFAGLADSVATKGGMTEAMIAVLQQRGMTDSIKAAMTAALEKAKGISTGF